MLQEFNQVMDYIESRLTGEVNAEEIAKISGVSDYHFRRMFSYLSGMPLNEYIRNRKLSLANQDLVSGAKVTEVAFSYGYQSADGFSRAFREWAGFLPSEASKHKIQKTFPKFSFIIDIKGGVSMEFKIEKRDAFQLIGVSKKVPIQFEGENPAILELAQSITEEQVKEMHEIGDLYPNQVVNASCNFDEGRLQEKGSLTHMIGFLSSKENAFEDLTQIKVPAHTWAVFPSQGPFPAALQTTWANIYAEWLPSSGYQLADAPEISFTRHGDSNADVYSEIWIAVAKSSGSGEDGTD